MVKKYYQKHKEKLRKEARGRRSLSEEEKEKGQKRVRDIYQNLFKEESIIVSIIVSIIRIFLKKKKRRKLSI